MKNLTFQLFLIACMAGLLFSGCAPVYVSNRLNTPLFDDGSQANIGIGYGEDGTSFNGAITPVNRLAFIGNYSHTDRTPNDNDKFKHSIWELGAGYYNDIPLKGEKEYFFYEGFLGYGKGQSHAVDDEDGNYFLEKSVGEYGQFFVQPSIGYRITNFAMAGSLRLNFINFERLEIEREGHTKKAYSNLKANSFVFAGTIYGWFEPVRIGLQAGGTLLWQSGNEDVIIDFAPLILNFSVEYTIRGKKKAE